MDVDASKVELGASKEHKNSEQLADDAQVEDPGDAASAIATGEQHVTASEEGASASEPMRRNRQAAFLWRLKDNFEKNASLFAK